MELAKLYRADVSELVEPTMAVFGKATQITTPDGLQFAVVAADEKVIRSVYERLCVVYDKVVDRSKWTYDIKHVHNVAIVKAQTLKLEDEEL